MWALESSAFDDAVQTWNSADVDGEHSRIRFEETPSLLLHRCIGEAECLYLKVLYQQTTRTHHIGYLYLFHPGS